MINVIFDKYVLHLLLIILNINVRIEKIFNNKIKKEEKVIIEYAREIIWGRWLCLVLVIIGRCCVFCFILYTLNIFYVVNGMLLLQ